ncbi:MAG: hypothetical protein J5608_02795 [Alphaproteobacteria bacterium]|nr:hypothetical protein [Alphaproteobacteria bacterium]
MANKIKDKIKEAFSATPTVIRWMLLGAAFIVVLILLFLLISKPKHATNILHPDRKIDLVIEPASAELLDVLVGSKKPQTFKINATHPAIIDSVEVKKAIDGFIITNTCDGVINQDIPCKVIATFAPPKADISGETTLVVTWHDQEDLRDTNQRTNTIHVKLSAAAAVAPKPVQEKVEPVTEPEPIIEPEIKPVAEPEPEPEEPIIEPEEDEIAGSQPILEKPVKVEKPVEQPKKRAEKCSDFAMPGYSTAGAQIGWIKPKNGRYEFHPFSDKDCNKPTGIYNPNTGIITSIDSGKKIGTDADHTGKTVDLSKVPNLTSKPGAIKKRDSKWTKASDKGPADLRGKWQENSSGLNLITKEVDETVLVGSGKEEAVKSTMPFDRTFILRQFKPIPATIVSEVRADPSVYGCDLSSGKCDPSKSTGIPVRATVDRNVYSDNGRTVIIPTGTLLMGYLTGELPGPYKTIGRMQIKWYQFIRPDGVEFNFQDGKEDPYSADSQGRVGVPGYGSTDYIEQMVMPLLTAMVPAAVNMIAPIADTFVNQIDLDNNTVVQSGKVRSSELAKNEVITAWNQVAQKLIVDALDNTVPPFSIAAGTRITVYSPVDLIATCGDKESENAGKKCAFTAYGTQTRRKWADLKADMEVNQKDSSWTGQSRGFNLSKFCKTDNNDVFSVNNDMLQEIADSGYDYRTVLAYCQSLNYQAKNQAKYDAYYTNKMANTQNKTGMEFDQETGKITKTYEDKDYNKEVLGLEYEQDENGNDTDVIKNPFEKPKSAGDSVGSVNCDGAAPDANGCCPGETYTDMGDQGFNCCPAGGGDCFPPLEVE